MEYLLTVWHQHPGDKEDPVNKETTLDDHSEEGETAQGNHDENSNHDENGDHTAEVCKLDMLIHSSDFLLLCVVM